MDPSWDWFTHMKNMVFFMVTTLKKWMNGMDLPHWSPSGKPHWNLDVKNGDWGMVPMALFYPHFKKWSSNLGVKYWNWEMSSERLWNSFSLESSWFLCELHMLHVPVPGAGCPPIFSMKKTAPFSPVGGSTEAIPHPHGHGTSSKMVNIAGNINNTLWLWLT